MNLDFRLSLISVMTMSLDLLRSLRSTKQEHIFTTHTRTILTDFTARTSEFRAARAREGTVVVDTGGAVETRVAGTRSACNDNGSEGRSSNNTSNSTSNGFSTLDDGILRVYQGGGGGGRGGRTRHQPEMNLDFRLSLISVMTMSLALLRSLRSTKQEHIVTTHTRTILTDFTARTSEFRAARAREGTVVVDTGGAVETRVAGTRSACNDNGSEGRSSNNTSNNTSTGKSLW